MGEFVKLMNDTRKNKRKKRDLCQESLELYEVVGRVLDNMKEGEIGFKEAFSKSNVDPANMPKVYAISLKVVNNWKLCNEIIEESGIISENPEEKLNIIKPIVADFLWGSKQIVGKERVFDIVRAKKDVLQELTQKFGEFKGKSEGVVFVRVNTIKYTINQFEKHLKGLGYNRISTPGTYSQYLEAVSKLRFNFYMKDYHFDDLFVFTGSMKSHLCKSDTFRKKFVTIQDKSSLIPVNILKVEPGSTVLDMCAAPGMKTVYLAAQLQQKGKILAVDRDKKRFQTMVSMINCFGASDLIEARNDDITHFECNNDDIDFILLDAPCSGSGIRGRLGETDLSSSRLRSLQWLQMKMLTQALTQYPNVKRVVYSTCSTNCEENEFVVDAAIEKSRENSNLELIDCHRILDGFSKGSSDYECGPFCLRVDTEKDNSNGFFTAVFQNRNLEEIPEAVSKKSKKAKKRKVDDSDNEQSSNNVENQYELDDEKIVKKKKKKRAKISKEATKNKFLEQTTNSEDEDDTHADRETDLLESGEASESQNKKWKKKSM